MDLFAPLIPVARAVGRTAHDTIIECPLCGHVDLVENWDCVGASDGCLWCNGCGEEVRWP